MTQPFHVACMHFSTCAAIRYARGQPDIVVRAPCSHARMVLTLLTHFDAHLKGIARDAQLTSSSTKSCTALGISVVKPLCLCKWQVEEEYRVEGMPVHWYMVSDCPALRYKAAKKYGPKVSYLGNLDISWSLSNGLMLIIGAPAPAACADCAKLQECRSQCRPLLGVHVLQTFPAKVHPRM